MLHLSLYLEPGFTTPFTMGTSSEILDVGYFICLIFYILSMVITFKFKQIYLNVDIRPFTKTFNRLI